MKKIVFILITFISLKVYAANEGWKNCDDDGTANCEYQIKDGVLTVRPQDNLQPASIPDYERDCSMTKYYECTTTAPWKWDEDTSTVTTLKIESGITSIGQDAFEDMPFTDATLPNGLLKISALAFHQSYLATLDMPDSVTYLGANALSYCNLQNIKLSSNLEEVRPLALGGNWGLADKRIVIPDSVTNLSPNAFSPSAHFVLYCSADLMEQCQTAALTVGASVVEYKKTSDGRFVAENKMYKSLSDIWHDIPVKRIYTIEEANAVAGNTNRVSIKYR